VIIGSSPSSAVNRAVESPLVRGGLTLVFGVLTGNVIGFARVALTAYLLGTHSAADSLAVAMGPVDALNSVLINSIVFAFVPMLTAREGPARAALLRQLTRCWLAVSVTISAAAVLAAPWLMRALAPGLDPAYFGAAVTIFRILALSTTAAGIGAVQCALLYTQRRFAPTAFYQAALNASTVICAIALWKWMGVYAFAIGYTMGAWLQLAIVWISARRGLEPGAAESSLRWSDLLMKPAFFAVYAAGLGANIVFTRAYATHAGPGMAAALDYCMRGVGVPLALLVSPISNSLLPEIARRGVRDALRLIDRTIAIAGLAAVAGCAFALAFRQPAIAFFFERGSFTAESTRLVSAVFLGFGPSLIGWSLIEITARSLFGMSRPWPPVLAVFVPVALNVVITSRLRGAGPEWLGVGSSIGLMAGFFVLFALMHAARKNWSAPRANASSR
jgi:peptidoglycan biosynthesis protein MviN/MurJ (putative lipid II flippase)